MQHQLSNLSTLAHHRRHIQRQQVDDLLALAEYLPKPDKIFIHQVLSGDLKIAQLARLYQRPPRHLQRKASSIIKRLSNKTFKFVAIQMESLPLNVRTTAKYVVLDGLSMRKASQVSGISLYRVRQDMNTVQVTARVFV